MAYYCLAFRSGIPISTITTPNRSDLSGGPFDDPYLGFAESIDNQTIWIAKWNIFRDVFDPNSPPCVSGVTVNQYNLDPHTYLPTNLIQTLLFRDMQYGMLLAKSPQAVVLLTQVTSPTGNAFNWEFIGNTIKDLWMVLTINSTPNPPNNNFPVFIDILPSPPNQFPTISPIASGTRTVIPFSLDPFLKSDPSHIGPYLFRINVMGQNNYTDYFDTAIDKPITIRYIVFISPLLNLTCTRYYIMFEVHLTN